MRVIKLIGSQPFRLISAVILAFVLSNILPLIVKQFFLALSLTLKEILMFMIPFIIFSSVYSAFVKIRGNAILFVILLLLCIILSNFISVTIAGIFSFSFLREVSASIRNPEEISMLSPLWQFSLPKPLANNFVLISSLLLACVDIPKIEKPLTKFAKIVSKMVDIFLKKFFINILPIFIFGFLIKLLADDIIGDVLAVNPKAFIFMIVTLLSYLTLILAISTRFSRLKVKTILRNILAPTITAFTTMSSSASIPFSIKAAEANTGNKNIADVVIPATSSTHMIGDSICIPIVAMILLSAFGLPLPSISAYLTFAISFVITKFSGAGIPGGSILIMIPVLESCLNFSPEMSALITVFYMLLDPICTSGNVIGNNIFVIYFTKLYTTLTEKNLIKKG